MNVLKLFDRRRWLRHRGGASATAVPAPRAAGNPPLVVSAPKGDGNVAAVQPTDQVVFEFDKVFLHTLFGGPRGRVEPQTSVPVAAFADELCQRCLRETSVFTGLVPAGVVVRSVYHRNTLLVFLIEVPPGPRTMQWLCDNSPAAYGPQAEYRDVTVSLPWQYFFVTMFPWGRLAAASSAYFLPVQLSSLDQTLCDPHFFNCSVDAYGAYCWVCQQSFPKQKGKSQSLVDFALTFIEKFFYGGFNQSSEHHEGQSFWGRNRVQIRDSRVQTIDAWEAATALDPDVALSVPWLPSRHTAQSVFEELTAVGCGGRTWIPRTTADFAGIVTACAQAKGETP